MKILTMMLTACALSATASAQVPDFSPQTPLLGALLHNDRSAAKQLLASGADPTKGSFSECPRCCSRSCVRTSISYGC